MSAQGQKWEKRALAVVSYTFFLLHRITHEAQNWLCPLMLGIIF